MKCLLFSYVGEEQLTHLHISSFGLHVISHVFNNIAQISYKLQFTSFIFLPCWYSYINYNATYKSFSDLCLVKAGRCQILAK